MIFISTANVVETIPGPLRDRMEIIQLPGYTQEEKLEIARRYLVARQLKENGLKPEQFEIADAALTAIIRDYTREAGVRSLERQIGAVCRRAAVRIRGGAGQSVKSDEEELAGVPGRAEFEKEGGPLRATAGGATGAGGRAVRGA